MDRVYIDTSAYLAILLGEKDTDKIFPRIKNKILCSSSLIFTETERNLVQMVRNKQISEDDFDLAYQRAVEDIENFVLLNLTPNLCFTRSFPIVQTPRSADLVHLRSAQWFLQHGSIIDFISLDQKQVRAARELGLPVVFV